jgi:hypothetical protein
LVIRGINRGNDACWIPPSEGTYMMKRKLDCDPNSQPLRLYQDTIKHSITRDHLYQRNSEKSDLIHSNQKQYAFLPHYRQQQRTWIGVCN